MHIADSKKVEESSRIWRKWEQQTNFVWKPQMESPFMRSRRKGMDHIRVDLKRNRRWRCELD